MIGGDPSLDDNQILSDTQKLSKIRFIEIGESTPTMLALAATMLERNVEDAARTQRLSQAQEY
ncbi:MAG: hypothetical protein K9L65_12970, partial [Chromatiaceae bacterium]|nr:hypothetical protein [Chromatiaceae bacterium]